MKDNLICEFCNKPLEYSEIPVQHNEQTLHYFCYKVKKYVMENKEIILNLLDEK